MAFFLFFFFFISLLPNELTISFWWISVTIKMLFLIHYVHHVLSGLSLLSISSSLRKDEPFLNWSTSQNRYSGVWSLKYWFWKVGSSEDFSAKTHINMHPCQLTRIEHMSWLKITSETNIHCCWSFFFLSNQSLFK